jgi:CheY-like chemotaxis protein
MDQPEKGKMVCKIIDEGIGIRKLEQDKLFNLFNRLETHMVENDGTGLGLVITQKLVKLLGGDISFMSDYGKGSTFTFYVPFKTIDENEEIIQEQMDIVRGRRVLFVDDNADNRIIISSWLYEWGMIPTVFPSGKEALHSLEYGALKFDLGIVDINMPEMDGYELAEKLYEKYVVKLIALSSVNDFRAKRFAYILQKPVNKVFLFTSITTLLKNTSLLPLEEEKVDLSSVTASNILIVEDAHHNQMMLKRMLEVLGFENVYTASTGKECIRILKTMPFDIVLMDLKMPDMNGYETMEYIQSDPELQNLKIIVVTAYVTPEDRNRCDRMGVKFFIEKPVRIETIRNALFEIG